MESPSNNNEGDIKNSIMNSRTLETEIIINTGIFDHSIIIQKEKLQNIKNKEYKNNDNITNEEENESEVTEIIETELENSPKISPEVTEVDEAEKNNIYEIQSMDEINEETNNSKSESLYKINEKNLSEYEGIYDTKEENSIKIEIVEVDKVKLLNIKTEEIENENISIKIRDSDSDIFNHSSLIYTKNQKIEERAKDKTVEIKENKAKNISEIPVVRSDNGLWWIFDKSDIKIMEEKDNIPKDTEIVTSNLDHNIKEETSKEINENSNNKAENISEIPVIRSDNGLWWIFDKFEVKTIKEKDNIPTDTEIAINNLDHNIKEGTSKEINDNSNNKAEDISEIPIVRSDNGLWWIFDKSEIKTMKEKDNIPKDTEIVTSNLDHNIKEETSKEINDNSNNKAENISEIPVIRSDNGLWWIFDKSEIKIMEEKDNMPTGTEIITSNLDHNIKEETNKEINENSNNKAEDISEIPIVKSDNGLWWIFDKSDIKIMEEKDNIPKDTEIVTSNLDHNIKEETSKEINENSNNKAENISEIPVIRSDNGLWWIFDKFEVKTIKEKDNIPTDTEIAINNLDHNIKEGTSKEINDNSNNKAEDISEIPIVRSDNGLWWIFDKSEIKTMKEKDNIPKDTEIVTSNLDHNIKEETSKEINDNSNNKAENISEIPVIRSDNGLWWIFDKSEIKIMEEKDNMPTGTEIITSNLDHNIKEETNKEINENSNNKAEDISEIPIVRSDNGLWWIFDKSEVKTIKGKESIQTNTEIVTDNLDHSTLIQTSNLRNKDINNENNKNSIWNGTENVKESIKNSKSKIDEINLNENSNKKLKIDDNMNIELKYKDEKSISNVSHINVSDHKNNSLSTAVYLILSCSEKYSFEKEYITINPVNKDDFAILNSDMSIIKEKNNNFYNELYKENFNCDNGILCSIEGKNIYLYKVNLFLNKNEVSFTITIKYLEDFLISSKCEIKNGQHQFICCGSLKWETSYNNYWTSWYAYYKNNSNEITNFTKNKYKIQKLQIFIIFKYYLIFNKMEKYMSNLLKFFLNDIEKSKDIELELILEILSILSNNKKSILELPKESKEIFENVIKNLKQKKNISFNNEYKEKYHEIVHKIDIYSINLKGELNLYLNLLILIFINSDNNPENFNEYFNRIDMKEEAFKFIKDHKKCFSNLQVSNLELLFENNKNKNKFNDILSLTSSFNEYLKFFSLKGNYILNEKPKIDFNHIPKPDESTEINLLIPFFDILKAIPIKNKEIDKIKEKIKILIGKLEKKDLIKLYVLKEVSLKYFNILSNEINYAIHITGNYFIKNNKLKNLEIIKFIHEDAKNYPYAYKNDIEFATLIKYIKLDEVDDEFCFEFNNSNGYFYNYKQLLENNFELFINSIINCAKTFRHMNIVYKIFDIENKFEYEDQSKRPHNQIIPIIKLLIDHILTLDRDGMITEELGTIFGPLFKLISDYNNHNINQLFKNIKKKFSSKEINEIFAYVLVHQNLNDNMVEKLVDNMNELSSDNVISYLNQFENEKIRNLLLMKLDKNIISKNEIFNENLTDNLKILRALINMDYFKETSDELYRADYIIRTRRIMNNLKEELEELEFKMDQLKLMKAINKNIDNENNLENRLFLITLGNQDDSNYLYQLLIDKINKCNEIYGKIDEIIKINSYFFPNDKKSIIEFYKRLKEEIMEKPIKEFPDMNQPELEDYKNLYNEAHKISGLKRSKFFISIYENNKKKALNNSTDSSILEETKKEFFNLKNLFDIETENKVDIKFLEEVISKIDNDKMEDEIEILKIIFEIDKPITNLICKKLKVLNNKNETIKLLENIIKLFTDFKLKGEISNYIIYIIKKLKYNSSLNILVKSYESLKKSNLNISYLNINLSSIINDIYNKPELIEFLIKTKPDDIHLMSEFIDDVEDIIIDLRDINNLESCSSFISKLKHYDSLSEREFLNKFNEIIQEDKFKDIGLKFKDASGKYGDFKELYTNYLNPNELNKVHIELVYKLSTFYIQYSGFKYTCKAKYEDKTKNFDDMLDLRDIALLRKKDQKEGYLEICDTFANIISDIQEILDLLNIIESKGYFEEINFIIKVIKGNAQAYRKNKNEDLESKSLTELIKQLNNIIINQCKEVKDIYLNYPISRLIYGRQFAYLYKYINSRSHNYSIDKKKIINNILKYVTNDKVKFKFRGIQNRAIEGSSLKQMFKNINYYLNVLFDMNNIEKYSVFENAILTNQKRGLYTHYSSDEEIECEVIRCSLNLTGNFPSAQTVLYCNNYTSDDELLSFIYKSIKCEINALFILIYPEKLTTKRKKMLIDLLNEHYSLDEMKSCLLILYANENKTNDIITEIEKISYSKYTDIKSEKSNENVIKYIPNVEIYSSEFSGLGKSTLIKKDFEEKLDKYYKYIYFSLGDNINKDEIIQRLLKLPNEKIALHVDLYNSKQIELIREFLFTFLVLRCYSKNEKIFFFERHTVKIKVEIPNGFIDFKTLFPIFKYFKNVRITSDSIPPLIVTNDITSNVQIVCNYLNNINEINEKDMYFEGITVNDYNSNSYIKATPLSQEECQNLIFQNLHIENPNYYQIESFINLIAEQLRLLTKSIYLNVEQLNYNGRYKRNTNLNKIRKFFIESLVKITKHFITSSYDNTIKGQNVTYNQQQGKIDLEKANKEANEILTNKKTFSIKQIQPSMILINEDGQSISEIVTCQEYTEEYNLLQAIFNSDSQLESRKIIDYSQLGPDDFLKEVRKVLNLYNKLDKHESGFTEELNGKKLRYLKDIVDNYIFTEDNFIKLLLISLRLRTNIPVVMMGETGCGKTSLIKIIAELKGITMHILNIHAGIEDNDIIKFLKEKQLFINYDNNENDNINDNNNDDEEKDVWVFLDEINTCNSLGLITEIMLKHSCRGEKIKNNIKFIAACNPYRLDTGEKEIVGLYDEAKHIDRKLVYNVNPLPHSLLNYVFDFKTPEEEDIERYISNIVYKTLEKSIPDIEILNKIKTIAVKSLFNAHKFIKTQFDISSVSLREIRRWQVLFKWFIELLRKPFFKKKYELPEDQIYLYSLNLSIYLCYYMRIFKKEKRSHFLDEMKKTFGDNFDFERLPKRIQEDIADATELDKGIAKNRPILENLFAIFVCSNTKIPLFIVGKPGCSKTLSAKLIFMSMRGPDSSSEFFKDFPKIYTKSYQGSLNSNSTGILKIFRKARNSLKKLSGNIISAIYFDEMGLAEISNNNPLKVIHSELEYDDNEEKVSFIGISNWPLDASKMNRGIHLSIPEPDEDDLITTSLAIAESYDQILKLNYNQELENLALSYFEYKRQLKDYPYKFESPMYSSVLNSKENSKKNINEFHGTRDFYHLIKTFSKLLILTKFPEDRDKIEKVLCKSIERNFGGLENSVNVFKEIFKHHDSEFKIKKKYNVMKRIYDNIIEPKSRYLLLITNSPANQFLVSLILRKLQKHQVIYYGSKFKEDISEGYYCAKILNKIQVTMSNDNVMMLRDLESVYPSLYDFFNQNFRKTGECEYARIALGNANTQNYYVNNNLKCIILLDKSTIHKQDPPFLNRFEKHIISFEYILKRDQMEKAKIIYKLINDNLIEIDKGKTLKIDLKSELINCSLEEIQGFIYTIFKDNSDIINNNVYGEFSKETTFELFVNQYSSERSIEGRISDFYNNDKKNLFILHFHADDSIHLRHINYLISNIETTYEENLLSNKIILFIIHLKRRILNYEIPSKKGNKIKDSGSSNEENKIINDDNLISHLSEWNQLFIDNLNGIDISLKEIFNASSTELFNNIKLIDLNDEFKKDLFHAFTIISYNYKINFSSIPNEKYIEALCEYINTNKKMENMIKNSVKERIQNNKENILLKIYYNYSFEDNDVDFKSIIIKYLKSFYNRELINTLILFENNNILSTKLVNKDIEELNCDYFDEIYEHYINEFNSSDEKMEYSYSLNNSKIDLYLGISYPYIITVFKNIKVYINELINDYIDNDNNVRSEIYSDNQEYFEKRNLLEENLKTEFEKHYIGDLFKDNSRIDINSRKKLIKLLFNDYIIFYLSNCNDKLSCVNDVLCNLFESFVHCILINHNFNKIQNKSYKKLLTHFKSISQEIMNFNEEFRLILKEILYFNDLILVIEFFNINKISSKDNIQKYYEILSNENKIYLLKENNNGIFKMFKKIDPVVDEFKFLKNTISDKKDYVDLLIKLLHNKMKISKDEGYREKLINIICSDNSYIAKSSTIFDTIFSKFNLCPTNKTREIQNDNESVSEIVSSDGDNEYESINNKYYDSEYDYSNDEDSDENDNYPEEEDETGLLFLSELEDEKTNSIIKTINKTDNKVLDEVLLSLFDKEFSKYFKNKKSYETLILSQSLSIFKKCIEYIEKEKNKIKKDNRIAILYCISYIKYYCYQFSKIVYEDKDDILPIYEIISFLKSDSNYNKTIKFIKKKDLFYEDFDFTEKIPCSLEYLFIQNDTFDNYKKLRKEYINSKNKNFKSTDKILNILEKEENKIKWILDFYDLMINEEISHLSKSELDENYETHYNLLSQFNSTIINCMNLSSLSISILKIYFNNRSIKRELSFIHSLPFSTFEMLLYSHKLAFMCSFSQQNSVYSNILSPNVLHNLKAMYIPGGEPNDSLLIQSGDKINEDFQNGTTNGIYMCSCNLYYNIGGCGFPMVTQICRNCGKLIGGTNHKLIQREGHFRVFKDENQRRNDYYVINYHFYVPYIVLSELMNKVENERRIQIRGLKRVKRNFYIDNKKKVRNISTVTYRILSFIFYSCIYADIKIGYLSTSDLEKFYYSDVNNNANNNNSLDNLLSVMMDNYNSLIKELKIRGIENIQCFLNLIIPKIYPVLIENDKTLQTSNERNEFEMKCNTIIEDIIENYRKNNEIYIENNKKILEIKDDTIKSIIQETSNLNTLSSNKNYPLINYFTVANYPSEDDFNKQFKLIPNRNDIYPVTTRFINYREDKDKIINDIFEIFRLINPFITYVLDKYNNKISRMDAKKILIKDELNQDKLMKKLFKSFRKGWKMVYGKLLNYDCNGNLPPKDITEECCLAYVLNDNLENDFGKYISTAYKTIITVQNEFLTSLLSDNKKIIVQKANPKEIVSLNIESNIFDSFEDIVSIFSMRNYSYFKDGGINYLNYKNITYDVDSIENELSKLLLSGKKLLKEETEQEYINYAFEAFNQDETIIERFNKKISNKKLLSNEEKTKLMYEIKSIDYKLVIFNMQSLFLYFINIKNITGDEHLAEEINKIPEKILRLDHEFTNIFQRPHFDITLNKLIDCYEYIEQFNFQKILRNVPRNTELDENELDSLNLPEYINAYAKLKDQQKEMLNKHFENSRLIITKNDLNNAIRKYISRYMVNERYNKFNINVFDEIRYRSELWNDNINSDDHVITFNDEINQLIGIDIKIGQIIDLYSELKNENTDQKPKNKNKNNNNRRTNKMDVKRKSFGLPILKAMACGIPVMCAKAGAINNT
ncbi:hypothetical protein H8356DRAFT_1007620 [Neocallimastix lanati (nom. inval.)]|uniref:RZ-type domain-containing protein n=1 Tax=Neocallimastix californiae TaxID=1754190 RepID=A0A1Y2D3Z2_9FUNG|nr:hypothetical protein H8356DRAFT_1007620 [Neocallimastix sp. JGI-2020a]ORY54008.1 hypothetical protein LY90DRAFT_507885 [Neocallimastix californiae]|eukprot:ORY54008.1 hypothetical protein LY90DRAFT_507885 [Neocallimastix californiae]